MHEVRRRLGELMFLDVRDQFEVGSANQFLFCAGGLFEEDNIDIVEGGEFFLDRPDELFVPDADPLSWIKVHGSQKVGLGGVDPLSQEWVKDGLPNGNRSACTMVMRTVRSDVPGVEVTGGGRSFPALR